MITDLKYLQQATGNDADMMREMIELYLSQLTEMRADLRRLADNESWMELSRLAHKVKSSALVMGIEPMANDMKELETVAKEGRSTWKCDDYIESFNTMSDIIKVELRAYLDSERDARQCEMGK